MLKVSASDIKMNQSFTDKHSAIVHLAEQLVASNLVQPDYGQGMLERESQHSTYLGNGIAIPHGTQVSKNNVLSTGVSVAHYPNGIDWGDGEIVYCAVGIAAKSDEHLNILKQLTSVLGNEHTEKRLKEAKTEKQVADILTGKGKSKLLLTPETTMTDFPAGNMNKLLVVGSGLMANQTNNEVSAFVDSFLNSKPTHLSNGIWLACEKISKTSQVSFVSTSTPFECDGVPVKGIVCLSIGDHTANEFLENVSRALYERRFDNVNLSSSSCVIELFSPPISNISSPPTDSFSGEVETFVIRNEHGLHARPGAVLVATVKDFSCNIQVANVTTGSELVNAKSLMKVIGLGVKKDHQLKFVAKGDDAQEALKAIGIKIQQKLGEA